MPEIKSYAIECHDRLPVYIQHGERFNLSDGIAIVDYDLNKVWMFYSNNIKSIREGVFDEK